MALVLSVLISRYKQLYYGTQVEDYVTVIEHLAAEGIIDKSKVIITVSLIL